MVITIGMYEELIHGKGYPSMKEYMEPAKYCNQDRIVTCLKNGEKLFLRASTLQDAFTDKMIHMDNLVLS